MHNISKPLLKIINLVYNIKKIKKWYRKKVIVILEENERIDDLNINNYKIIQNNEGFCFGIDSVILSEFAKDMKKDARVVDLGTGTGILGFLLLAKTKIKEVVGIEVQKEVCEMASKSVKLNNLESKFKIINCNIKEALTYLEKESFDVVITNPPYKKLNTGRTNNNEKKLISRHEILADIYDFIETAKLLLKNNGVLYMVHRPERLTDILYGLRKNRLEPKNIRFVYSKEDSEYAKLVLIKAVKNGGNFLKIEKPLYIYKNDGTYTDEINKIYNIKNI